MSPFLAVADLDHPAAEPFCVLSIDPSQRVGNGVKAVVVSLHWTRAEAEAEIAKATGAVQ